MKVIDNINILLKDELIDSIKKGSKMSIAASCFSMYAYKELKKQLDSIDELRFIFTSPTFVKESSKKEKREFFNCESENRMSFRAGFFAETDFH